MAMLNQAAACANADVPLTYHSIHIVHVLVSGRWLCQRPIRSGSVSVHAGCYDILMVSHSQQVAKFQPDLAITLVQEGSSTRDALAFRRSMLLWQHSADQKRDVEPCLDVAAPINGIEGKATLHPLCLLVNMHPSLWPDQARKYVFCM